MNEKNYLIQFDYGGNGHCIHVLSHFNFSGGNVGDKIWLAETIENYIKTEGLHINGEVVSNVRLFGANGESIISLSDLAKIE